MYGVYRYTHTSTLGKFSSKVNVTTNKGLFAYHIVNVGVLRLRRPETDVSVPKC